MSTLKLLYKKYKTFANTIAGWYMKFLMRVLCDQVTIGNNFVSHGLFKINAQKTSVIWLGDNVEIRNRLSDNFVGLNKQSSIAVSHHAVFEVGDNSGFSNISIYCSKAIKIGKHCNFGGNCFIWDTDFHALDYLERRKPDSSFINASAVIIGDDVFIGANTIILKGSRIGDRAVIGAGSVVSRFIPSDEIWAGNPIQFIRKISDSIATRTQGGAGFLYLKRESALPTPQK